MKIVRLLKRCNASHWPDDVILQLRHAYSSIDGDIKLTIEKDNETRRVKQNRLLWMWHNELAKHIEEHVGEIHNSDDIHEYVSNNLLPKRVVNFGADPMITRAKTSQLKVAEFADFLTRYEMWAAEKYQCLFTKPDDLYWQSLMMQIEQEQPTEGM
jgi:hypothetical protein